MQNAEIRQFCRLDAQTVDLLKNAVQQMRLSARAYRRFYLRPAFVRRVLPRLARPHILWAMVRSAYRIITERQIY